MGKETTTQQHRQQTLESFLKVLLFILYIIFKTLVFGDL